MLLKHTRASVALSDYYMTRLMTHEQLVAFVSQLVVVVVVVVVVTYFNHTFVNRKAILILDIKNLRNVSLNDVYTV